MSNEPMESNREDSAEREPLSEEVDVRSVQFHDRDIRPLTPEELANQQRELRAAQLSAGSALAPPVMKLSAPSVTAGSVDFATRPPATSVPAGSFSAEILAQAVKGEYQYAKLGLILGVMSILGGVILGLNGVAGHTSWTAKVLGLESNINDAAPGVVLFVVGIFFVWITKPRVKLGDLKG